MDFSFSSAIPNKEISYELVCELINLTPKRICFSSSHKGSLKRQASKEYIGKFVVPFVDTIKPIFEYETGLMLFPSKFDNYWLSVKTGEEEKFKKIEDFVEKYKSIVFLRDHLDLSVSLSENLNEADELTKIGKLEYDAKYSGSKAAVSSLAEECITFIKNTPYYDMADLVCAIPPSNPGHDNLPTKIVNLLESLPQKNISNYISWKKLKPQLKDLELDRKWGALDDTEMEILTDVKGKSIILIDDLYQSGTTMHYVAMRLKQAGAKHIYGLSIVKARNNTAYV